MLSAPVHEACSRPGHGGGLVTARCPSEQPAPARGPAARIQGLRRPEAGHGEAPVQARGRPRFKQKQEFQGHLPTSPPRPVRSCPLPDTVFLLNPEVILKKKTGTSFIFRTSSFVCTSSKINCAWLGYPNTVRSPWEDLSLHWNWAGSKGQGQRQDRTALVMRQGLGPWGGPNVCWRLPTPSPSVCQGDT